MFEPMYNGVVSHGSNMAPILFNTFINDIIYVVKHNILYNCTNKHLNVYFFLFLC